MGRGGLLSETGEEENRKLFPFCREAREAAEEQLLGQAHLPPSCSLPPCASASGGHQGLPLEGADLCRELLAPLWSQSREVSRAKRRLKAASSTMNSLIAVPASQA